MPAKKKQAGVGIKRETLTKVLMPFKEQFKKASRKPKGRMPSWFDTLSPTLQASIRAEAFKTDATAMPSPEEVGAAVLDFWSK